VTNRDKSGLTIIRGEYVVESEEDDWQDVVHK